MTKGQKERYGISKVGIEQRSCVAYWNFHHINVWITLTQTKSQRNPSVELISFRLQPLIAKLSVRYQPYFYVRLYHNDDLIFLYNYLLFVII